ncbi:UNKNOWN [Stylonychia lemnae]|uniref:Uncharacterized protein n=1 Tax=Stylonychia lemnae TaxID=5949 RepID=A0A078ACY3_STYLE|nr:UNKNOWN [Stylonychia lemnae]|eukprot:CDW78713.1 UNKNOWN [Stylonychia lemnae]
MRHANRRSSQEDKPKIWLDNYGAGNNASPLEVHVYWHEIMKLEKNSKKHHYEQNELRHRDLYNSYIPPKNNNDTMLKDTRFTSDFGKILVTPTSQTAGQLKDLLKYKNKLRDYEFKADEDELRQTGNIHQYYSKKVRDLSRDPTKAKNLEQTYLNKTGFGFHKHKLSGQNIGKVSKNAQGIAITDRLNISANIDGNARIKTSQKVRELQRELESNRNLRQLAERQLSQMKIQQL